MDYFITGVVGTFRRDCSSESLVKDIKILKLFLKDCRVKGAII
jgi:hypothetical protein